LVPKSQHCNTKNNYLRLKAQAWALFMFKFHQLNPCPTHAQTLSIKACSCQWSLATNLRNMHCAHYDSTTSHFILHRWYINATNKF
jgi:hypothetical protein